MLIRRFIYEVTKWCSIDPTSTLVNTVNYLLVLVLPSIDRFLVRILLYSLEDLFIK